jgi:nitroreductase
MDFFEVIDQRCSMRSFSSQPVEDEKLQKILETINRAPSAGNRQAYEVYLVTDAERRAALSQAAWKQAFVAEAPVVLVFCTHPALNAERYSDRGKNLYSPQDAAIACTFAMLAATALGLASVWVGAYVDEEVTRIMRLPEGQTPVAILPIGYPTRKPRKTSRRALEDIIHR